MASWGKVGIKEAQILAAQLTRYVTLGMFLYLFVSHQHLYFLMGVSRAFRQLEPARHQAQSCSPRAGVAMIWFRPIAQRRIW